MEFRKVAAALILAGTMNFAYADVCNFNPGSVTCGKGTIENLNGNGMVSINGTKITGTTAVNGMLNADDAHLNAMDINGSAILFKCTVNSEVKIKGALKASSSRFKSSIEIYSDYTRLVNTNVHKNINIHRNYGSRQKLLLEDNSEVNGDIVFENGNGTVVLDQSSKILGNVIGGKIISKKGEKSE